MYPQEIHSYLKQFLQENDCQILVDNDHYITTQLTIEMDKKIMNRPFYWKYIESINDVPCPAQLTFITDKTKLVEEVQGEVIHFGSPRLSQLFRTTKELGSFVQMHERVQNQLGPNTILTPWLGVNYKVSYYSDQTKEVLYSFGINLMTGNVVEDFQETLDDVDLDIKVSGNTFNLPHIISPIRALERLDLVIDNLIQQDDHTWAEEAKMRWAKDQKVLEHFYEGVVDKPDSYEMEKQAMEEQYRPKIKIDVINGGLFYLK
ncbi:YqhG family protein [Sporosarcina sp. G11-34]|uniref:YqhG family protein n=1 Tax=Sporosarcina sp. G11-34 TaxID=2849605 RepID=UPI0022A9634B|nr:YqhG family protein [Sporosarcina sp. G11-34]MCZ2260932.1 YqhG family protein [Sporosarcina sp. G11-34]